MTESGAGYTVPLFSYNHELLLIMNCLRVFFPLIMNYSHLIMNYSSLIMNYSSFNHELFEH